MYCSNLLTVSLISCACFGTLKTNNSNLSYWKMKLGFDHPAQFNLQFNYFLISLLSLIYCWFVNNCGICCSIMYNQSARYTICSLNMMILLLFDCYCYWWQSAQLTFIILFSCNFSCNLCIIL